MEATRFRDAYPKIHEAGAEVIGVSVDDQRTQEEFAASVSAPFPMIGDADRRISKLYGTLWPVLRRNQRVTFVINGDGIIVAKLRYELDIARHVNEVLDVLAAMPKPA